MEISGAAGRVARQLGHVVENGKIFFLDLVSLDSHWTDETVTGAGGRAAVRAAVVRRL